MIANEQLTIKELFSAIPQMIAPLLERFVYPWEVLPQIGDYLEELILNHFHDALADYRLYRPGIWMGKDVEISPTAEFHGPAIIGPRTQIRPGAFIRGNVFIGSDCVIGNSTELKNCILMDQVQVPHYNYVGDSILGLHAHLGAGSICSNLKGDGTNVTIHASGDIPTGLRKMGAILGDHANVGCSTVLNPGTVLGQRTVVYPQLSVRGVIGSDMIVKSMDRIVPRMDET